ncbi:MAG: heme biosynthesis protein HemY [Marinobacterium sp.]|nr:heme biosynthesis protein HemY [Marinobacterium sp.]
MKKLLLLLILVMVGGAWVGEKMVLDPGYVLLSYNNTTVESSLWVMLTALAIGFLVLHWLINLAFNTRLPTDKLRSWSQRRGQRKAHQKTVQGLLSLSEGNWAKAHKQLASSAERSDLALVNYLAAARAAHEMGSDQTADDMLNKARQCTPNADVAVGITQAQFQLARGQLEPCLALLLQLRRQAPDNTYIIKLLKDVYVQLKDWQSLSHLLPAMRKQQVLHNDAMLALTETVHINRLEDTVATFTPDTPDEDRLKRLAQAWDAMPADMKHNPQLVERYCELMSELGAHDDAESTLRDLIKREWDERLVALYGRIESSNPKRQLDQARKWSSQNPDSAALLLTLGRLSLRNKQWGEALKYFQQSMEHNPDRETLAELIRLLRHLGDKDQAEAALQEHLLLLSDKLPSLPMPDQETVS